ncbi:MAG TPA: hopanoid-associated sugar epimerase [Alphaproteobacteria bacterium]
MRALVTGASGFIGSAVLRRLVESGFEVRALVRPKSDRRNLEGIRCEIVRGDLTDENSLVAALKGCETLFHVAADYRLWVPNPGAIYRTNVEGTRNLMLAAIRRGISRVVYTSSVATLGLTADGSPADEDTPSSLEDMIGHYKRSKFLAEAAVAELARDAGLPAVIVNPSAPIGPRDARPTPTGRMIVQAARGKMPAYVDTGLNVVHVDDVAEGHLLAHAHGAIGERYILGGENLSLREILAAVAGVVGRKPPRVRLPHNLVLPIAYIVEGMARLAGSTDEPAVTVDGVRLAKKFMYFKCDKAIRVLGYSARPARTALEDAIAWFRENGYLA